MRSGKVKKQCVFKSSVFAIAVFLAGSCFSAIPEYEIIDLGIYYVFDDNPGIMANAFNHMVHALKDRMYQDMRLVDHVRSKISQLHESLKGDSLDIKKLSEQVREIDKLATELRDRKQL